jgi:hypothetical protein
MINHDQVGHMTFSEASLTHHENVTSQYDWYYDQVQSARTVSKKIPHTSEIPETKYNVRERTYHEKEISASREKKNRTSHYAIVIIQLLNAMRVEQFCSSYQQSSD